MYSLAHITTQMDQVWLLTVETLTAACSYLLLSRQKVPLLSQGVLWRLLSFSSVSIIRTIATLDLGRADCGLSLLRSLSPNMGEHPVP